MGLPPPGLDPNSCNGGAVAPRADLQNTGLLEVNRGSQVSSATNGAPKKNANHNDTIYATIADSKIFENMTLTVIVINAIWIEVDTQWNHEELRGMYESGKLPLSPVSDVIEHLFCFYFTVEIIIRFLAMKKKRLCIFDSWFVFDSFLVLFMVIETWIIGVIVEQIAGDDGGGGALASFSAFRLLRLLRLTRMVRIMRAVPELLTLVKGIGKAARAVSFILIFLVLIIYVFAIIFTSQIGEYYAPEYERNGNPDGPYWLRGDETHLDDTPTAIELFGTIGDSMMTLFTRGVLGDNLAETLEAIKDVGAKCDDSVVDMTILKGDNETANLENWKARVDLCDRGGGSIFLFWVFIVFFIITALTLLNMLIGVLCEVITESARQENESTAIKELDKDMRQAFATVDVSQDGLITRAEWGKMKGHKSFKASMVNLGVEEQHMDERLEQIQESLFGNLERDNDSAGPDEVVPMGRAGVSQRVGLSIDEFVTKVAEIRPDTPASALDIEVLRIQMMEQEKNCNLRLDVIEGVLAKLLVEAPAATDHKPSPAPITRDGIDQKSEDWLREVPTEELFKVLRGRAPPELGPPKVLTEGAGGNAIVR
mmetsp:Transcript_74014/g.128451  ORF Transcript_74014/g.128451 Transcript_74014/m.128451 type:complete len:597 (-) Transcript_74014:103-1893(-)